MNTIFFSRRHELRKDYYVIPFSCSDLMDIDTSVSYRDRTETAQKVLDQEKFFFATGVDNSLVLITKPQPYNKTIGEQIIKNLGEPNNLF